jgi:hypothetical protein
MSIRIADQLDRVELLLDPRVDRAIAPLVGRLRNRTLTRTQYRRLVSLIVQNAILTGQSDATVSVLDVVAQKWRKCPMRYIPSLPWSRLYPEPTSVTLA